MSTEQSLALRMNEVGFFQTPVTVDLPHGNGTIALFPISGDSLARQDTGIICIYPSDLATGRLSEVTLYGPAPLSIGRDESNNVVIANSPVVSRRQAEVAINDAARTKFGIKNTGRNDISKPAEIPFDSLRSEFYPPLNEWTSIKYENKPIQLTVDGKIFAYTVIEGRLCIISSHESIATAALPDNYHLIQDENNAGPVTTSIAVVYNSGRVYIYNHISQECLISPYTQQ